MSAASFAVLSACLVASLFEAPAPSNGALAQQAGAPAQQLGPPALPTSAPAESPALEFTEIAKASGVDFQHTFGDDKLSCILEDTGSGAALFDYDSDGFLDLYLVNGVYLEGISDPAGVVHRNAVSRLYHNRRDGTFEDVTAKAGVGHCGFGMGVAVGDYDNDGDPDLLVLSYGPNVMYRNEGDGTFRDVTDALDLAGTPSINGFTKWSVNAVFFDYDRDRDLDLFVANYLAFDPSAQLRHPASTTRYPGPESFRGQASCFYRNDGTRFTDVTEDLGLYFDEEKSMGISAADFDDDGALELFEAGDVMPNLLFQRKANGTYDEVGMPSGVALDDLGNVMSSMHGTVGDYDGDGRLDLFVPNLEHGCLYRNRGALRFDEVSGRTGLAAALQGTAGWGAQFADFDNDADLDLLVATGGADVLSDTQADRLLLNEGGRFLTWTGADGKGLLAPNVSRGAAFGDLDNDGDVDFVVNRKDQGGAALVVRNDQKTGHHWMLFDLRGSSSSRDAIGARVELQCAGRTQVRELQRSGSYLSQNDPRVHFGLGKATRVDAVRIRWPSGQVQNLEGMAVDQITKVQEPAR